MHSLLRFFIKYHTAFLFVFLELICLTFIVRYNNFQRVKFLNTANAVSGNVLERYNDVLEYFSLKRLNDELAVENARLRSDLQTILFSDLNKTIRIDRTPAIKALPAKVIGNSVNKRFNYITLDKGTNDSIKVGMGIVCRQGIVGQVINVSQNYSTALSVLNSRWSISAKLKNTGHFGPLTWTGNNPYLAVLEEIPYHVHVKERDEIITSGYSSIFPEGILIGQIVKIEHQKGDNFQTLWVQLSTDFANLHFVDVIEVLKKEERIQLENETINE